MYFVTFILLDVKRLKFKADLATGVAVNLTQVVFH